MIPIDDPIDDIEYTKIQMERRKLEVIREVRDLRNLCNLVESIRSELTEEEIQKGDDMNIRRRQGED